MNASRLHAWICLEQQGGELLAKNAKHLEENKFNNFSAHSQPMKSRHFRPHSYLQFVQFNGHSSSPQYLLWCPPGIHFGPFVFLALY